MAIFTVTKAVYLSIRVEADRIEEAISRANDTDYTTWDFNDQDEAEAYLEDDEE